MELPPLHFFGTMLKMKKIELKNKQINIEIEVIGIQRYPPQIRNLGRFSSTHPPFCLSRFFYMILPHPPL